MNLVQKEEKRRKEVEARALAFSLAQKSKAYVQWLQNDNAHQRRKVEDLEKIVAALKLVVTDTYKEHTKGFVAIQFSRVILAKFLEEAADLIKRSLPKDMYRIAEFIVDDRRLPTQCVEFLDNVLDKAIVDLDFGPTLSRGARDSHFQVYMYWPRNAEFRIALPVPEEGVNACA